MRELNYISKFQYDIAKAAPITAELHTTPSEVEAPYVAEMARAEAVSRFGQDAYTSGYTITTTIHSHLQSAANQALRQAIQSYDKRHGYRGVAGHHDITDIVDDSELIALLKEPQNVAGMKKAMVTAISEQSAEVLTAQGEKLTLEWTGLSWASVYVNHDIKKEAPKQTQDVLSVGDLIYLYREIPEKGDPYWRLAQIPAASGALVSVSPNNGQIVALVGGYDFYLSKFNRVTQAKRQPGSGFKPFIYSAALEAGFTPASLINDAPVVFEDDSLEAAWRPENYSGKFFGPTRLRYALTHSRNLVSIRLLRKMGIVHAINHATRFGFDKNDLPRDLSLALGSASVTPLSMARGYSVLANGGFYVPPYVIDSIRDDQGNVIYQANPIQVCDEAMQQLAEEASQATEETSPLQSDIGEELETVVIPRCAKRAITEQNHFLMHSMLRDVIQQGTARKARSLGRRDIAGKTGTTNDQRDAWFNGFNHHLVTTTWLGFDNVEPLGRGEVGGRAALPAWIDYMRVALNGIKEVIPDMPPKMVTMRIDIDTGQPVGVGSSNAIFEVFEIDKAPKLPDEGRSGRIEGSTSTNITPIEDPF
jgi:penicillin-binding protein 1A